MKRYKARGIVLNTVKYGDTSLVAQLLTDAVGRRSYMVQGIRSSHGRGSKAALFQPLFALEFEGLESPRTELDRFKEVHAGIVLRGIPFDVRKSTVALFMAEVLYRLIRESEPDPVLFDFVWGSVEALDTLDEGTANFHLWFLANLSRFLGFSPGNEHVRDACFDMREGLFTMSSPHGRRLMSSENAEVLRDLLECDVQCLGEIGLNRHRRVEFLDAMLEYYSYHLDSIHAVRSTKILREVF